MPTIANDHFRLPPDGVGKRVHAAVSVVLDYDNATGSFTVGDDVVGASSGLTGEVAGIKIKTGTTGTLTLSIADDVTVSTAVAGEDLEVEGTPIAKAVDAGIPIYGQVVHIAGGNNPHNRQFVDSFGGAFVTFPEGPQQIDGFGLSRFSTPSQVGSYLATYGNDTEDFYLETSGISANLVELQDESAIRLDVGALSGEQVVRTSNRYHLYEPGYSRTILMSVQSGDTGKDNVIRRWGYFDDDDGLYFISSGTNFGIGRRTSTTGAPVDNVVLQANFNKDTVDGTSGQNNLSGMTLDISKINIYWIDLQWLGAGRVRFGVYEKGRKITLHQMEHANALNSPYIKTATLPVRWEILNQAATASPSTLKTVCSSVLTDGLVASELKRKSVKTDWTSDLISGIGASEVYVASFRSKAHLGAIVNRKTSIPELLSCWTQTSPVIVSLYKDATIAGAAYSELHPDSAVECDLSATSISGGRKLFSTVVGINSPVNQLMPENFSMLGENLSLAANGSAGNTYSITVQRLGSGSDADAVLSLSFIDIG